MSYFSKNLKYLREKKHLSQLKLAELVKVNQSTIGRWESEEISPTLDNIFDLANALNISIADLTGNDIEKLDNSNTSRFNILYDKIRDLPEDKQKIIFNVTESIIKEIDEKDDNN